VTPFLFQAPNPRSPADLEGFRLKTGGFSGARGIFGRAREGLAAARRIFTCAREGCARARGIFAPAREGARSLIDIGF